MLTPDNPKNDRSLYPRQDFEPDEDNGWQISYLDIFTILLGFLFILLSFSNLNQIKLTSVSDLFQTTSLESEFITTPVEEIKDELERLLRDEIRSGKLEIVRELNDIRIRFSSDDLYQSGSATLQLGALDLLDRVLEAVKTVPYNDFHIDVEGHTDSTPISSVRYPSNWELSTARASKIVKYFSNSGIQKDRLKASGYADSQPRAAEEDSLGNPIPENKSLNRRVVLRLYYASADTQSQQQDTTASKTITEQFTSTATTCRYVVQAGNFEIFTNGFSLLSDLESDLDINLDIIVNGQQFLVRTQSYPSISEALEAYQKLSAHRLITTPGLVHQCYSRDQQPPRAVDYIIQFGAFEAKDNALAYQEELSRQHQISSYLAEDTTNYFKIVSQVFQQSEEAAAQMKRLEQIESSNEIFMDYLPVSSRIYDYRGQLQLNSFTLQGEAAAFSERFSEQYGIHTIVTQLLSEEYAVVTSTFKDWREAASLFRKLTQERPELTPVLHLREFRLNKPVSRSSSVTSP